MRSTKLGLVPPRLSVKEPKPPQFSFKDEVFNNLSCVIEIEKAKRFNQEFRISNSEVKKFVPYRKSEEIGKSHFIIEIPADQQPPIGSRVSVYIKWPMLLDGITPLQLIVKGRIFYFSEATNSEGARIKVSMLKHQFKTLGRKNM